MSNDEHHQHPDYEEEDVNPGFIVVLFGGIVLLVVIALGAMGGLVSVFSAVEEPPFIEDTRLPRSDARLQANPAQEWNNYQQTQQALLDSAGESISEAGRGRIPIDDAMATIAADGALPEFTAEATAEVSAKASPQVTEASAQENDK